VSLPNFYRYVCLCVGKNHTLFCILGGRRPPGGGSVCANQSKPRANQSKPEQTTAPTSSRRRANPRMAEADAEAVAADEEDVATAARTKSCAARVENKCWSMCRSREREVYKEIRGYRVVIGAPPAPRFLRRAHPSSPGPCCWAPKTPIGDPITQHHTSTAPPIP
jgi:hypothetical protein